MIFPRYQIGDIVKGESTLSGKTHHYLILDKLRLYKNAADLYTYMILETSDVEKSALQESVYEKFQRIA